MVLVLPFQSASQNSVTWSMWPQPSYRGRGVFTLESAATGGRNGRYESVQNEEA
jgi:hypothetical protein